MLFKETDACADRGLCHIQAVGSLDEATGRDDLYEGPGKFEVSDAATLLSQA